VAQEAEKLERYLLEFFKNMKVAAERLSSMQPKHIRDEKLYANMKRAFSDMVENHKLFVTLCRVRTALSLSLSIFVGESRQCLVSSLLIARALSIQQERKEIKPPAEDEVPAATTTSSTPTPTSSSSSSSVRIQLATPSLTHSRHLLTEPLAHVRILWW